MTQRIKYPIPSYEKEVEECDSIFRNVVKTIEKYGGYVVDLSMLKKAYATARVSYGDRRRKSQVLYLRHPLAVMEELSRLRCKTSVLAAALLHDTMEDCGMTYEELRRDFSYEVAQIVQAVTAIKAEERELDAHYATMTDDEKHAFRDRLTDAKLISSPYQREAFLVRCADRVHNLSTLDAVSDGKRLEKIAATRDFLIPAARKLGMGYYVTMLSQWCFQFEGEDYTRNRSSRLLELRRSLTRVSGSAYSRFDQILQEAVERQDVFSFPPFNPYARDRAVKGEDKVQTTHRRVMLSWEIARQLEEGQRQGSPLSFERSRLDLWEVLLTCSQSDLLSSFTRFFRQYLQPQGLFLEYLDQEAQFLTVRITDQYDNNYRIVLVPQSELEVYFIGDPEGERLTMINEEAPGDALRPQITVYSYSPRKGYKKFHRCVPYGATALDFAFIVSPPLAYTVRHARIHTWQEEMPPAFTDQDYRYPLSTILNDGDVVYFDADYFPRHPGDPEENARESISHAALDWFGDINTDHAKACLIRYFKEKYGK